MIATLKQFAPFIIYGAAFVLFILSMSAKNQYTVLFITALLPLRNVVEKLQSLPMGRDFLDIMIIVSIIGWFISAASKKHKLFEPSPINVFAILMILYTAVSVIHGSNYLGIIDYFSFSSSRVQFWKNFCTPLIFYFVVLGTIRDKKWVWRTVLVICITMLFMDGYLLRQLSWYTSIISRKKIHGTFVHLGPNEVAAFYNQYTMILLGLYFCMKRNKAKWLLLGLIYINTFIVLFLFSRAAYLGLAVGFMCLFLIKAKKFLIPLIFVAIFWQAILPEKVIQRIEMTTNEYGEVDRSSERRLDIWQQGLDLFYDNPLMGVGFGVFKRLDYDLGDTHNIYVKTLAEQGLLGIIIFLLLVFCFFTQGLRLYAKGENEESRGLGLGFAVAIIVLLVNNFFGNRWSYMELSGFLWVFAALVARLNLIATVDDKETLYGKSKKTRVRRKKTIND